MSSLPDPSSDGTARDEPIDPRADPFRPPSIPTLVWCLHCEEEYDSWRMQWRVVPGRDGKPHGFWSCGTEGCDGAGFGFDIFPVDPDYIDPDGRDMGGWVDDAPPDPDTDFDKPPDEPTPVRCECCGKQYSSAEMVWWVDEDCPADAFEMGGWTCPTEGCGGMGFGVDIRPTDPGYVDPEGRRILRPGEKPGPYHPPDDEQDIPF